MTRKKIPIPVDFVTEDFTKEEIENLVKEVYILNNSNIVVTFSDNTSKLLPLEEEKIDTNKVEKLREIISLLFDDNIFYLEKIRKDLENLNNNSRDIRTKIVNLASIIEKNIEIIGVHLSAKIYSEIKEYIDPEVIKSFTFRKGISSLEKVIKYLKNSESEKNRRRYALQRIYKMFNQYRNENLVFQYNQKNIL